MLELALISVLVAVLALAIKGRDWYRRRATKRAAERLIKNLVDFSCSIK